MEKPAKRHDGRREREDDDIAGDPGVGGLLSDPLESSGPHEEPDPSAASPSPDPEPPRQHGDWMPPRKDAGRMKPIARTASIMRRKSRSGMPRALFREGDGTTLDDLRVLATDLRG
jgi:hypothetical protein